MIISTARGLDILVDDEDYEYLSQFSWVAVPVRNGRFYAMARLGNGTRSSMHRLIMKPLNGSVVHHKNNNGLDNRRSNLEVTTQSFNLRAARLNRDVGVHEHKGTGKWRAQLRIDGKRVSLGMHATREAAIAAVTKARNARDGL